MNQGLLVCRTVLLSLLLATGLASIGADVPVIDKILIVSSGKGPAPEDLVRANMTSREGMEFSEERLSEDIKRLYRTGFIADIQTELIRTGPDRVTIRLKVAPKPTVRKIVIEGNRHFKDRRLRQLMKHGVGVILDETQMMEDAEAIRKRYRDSGFHQVRVTPSIQSIPNTDQVNLVFRVQEGHRYKIRGLEFRGNTAFNYKTLKKTIRSKPTFWGLFFRTGYLNDDELAADKDRLRMLYTEQGYLDFRVVKIERVANKKGTKVRLIFHLDEGAPYKVAEVEVTGCRRFSSDELMQMVRQKPGSVFNSKVERDDVRRIRSKYEVYGYLDFACYPRHVTDSSAHTVAIEYRIREGVPSHIRDIYIRGNQVTKDRVIRRELAILPGDLGNAAKIRASRSRLMNLNYFDSVDISPIATEQEGTKDILVTVKEKRTGQLSLGAGFSSEEALLGSFEITQANFDWRNWPHFTGGGQRLRLRLQAGTERDDFLLSFTEPWWLERRLRLGIDLFRHDRNQDQYDESRTGASVRVTRPLRPHWRGTVGLRVQQIELHNFDDGLSAELAGEEGSYTANSLMLSLSRDTRNRYLNPSSGSRLSLTVELEPELLGSYSNVYRIGIEGAKYIPLPRRCVLKIEAELGLVDKTSGDPVAIFDRYFAGGTYSIRGFDRREVGPVDVNEDSVGGKSLFRGTFELIYPIYERILGSVFCDYGNVWRDAADWNPAELNVSVGLGIQLNLPIGPIRLDYGWPVLTDEDHLKDNGGRLHFNIGYFF